jgi:hypothetical protein
MTDMYSETISWTLKNVNSNDVVISVPRYTYSTNSTLYEESHNIEDNQCYKFTIIDSGTPGGGLCCGGYYKIFYDGQLLLEGDHFDRFEISTFGNGCPNKPSISPTQTRLHGDDVDPNHKLGHCEGDCDYDSDCSDGLICVERNGFTKVPGCLGGGIKDYDYCVDPYPEITLHGDTDNPTHKLGHCEGDCDMDSQCVDNLVCFKRDGFTKVPGCLGSGIEDHDYCVDPNAAEITLYGDDVDPTHKLGHCEGDCDHDSDCSDGLVCFKRDGFIKVPGCLGNGIENYDYCVVNM